MRASNNVDIPPTLLARADECRKHGISGGTFYKSNAKYGGLDVSEAKRLKMLEDENAKLKKLVAEAMLDNAMLKDIASKKVTPAAGREAVAHLRVAYKFSERRACSTLGTDRSPAEGRVFLSRLGMPYADPGQYRLPCGSPIKKAHATACRRALIQNFRVHDWRHHGACYCVMSGIDLETIRQEGGWKSLRMVERYATVSAAHRAHAMKKLK